MTLRTMALNKFTFPYSDISFELRNSLLQYSCLSAGIIASYRWDMYLRDYLRATGKHEMNVIAKHKFKLHRRLRMACNRRTGLQ